MIQQTKKPTGNPESPLNPSRIKKSTSRHSIAKFRTHTKKKKREILKEVKKKYPTIKKNNYTENSLTNSNNGCQEAVECHPSCVEGK